MTVAGPAWATSETRNRLAAVADREMDSETRSACAIVVKAAKAGGIAGFAWLVMGSLEPSLAVAAGARKESAAEETAGRVAGPGTGRSWASASAKPGKSVEAATQRCHRVVSSAALPSRAGRSGC